MTFRSYAAVMLAAIALDQSGEPAATSAWAAASSAFGIGMRAAAWLTSLTFVIAATVSAEASGYASADERLWLGAAIVALVIATWNTRFRTNVEVTT